MAYIWRRLSLSLLSLVILSFLTAGVLMPGDAVMARAAESGSFNVDDIPRMRQELGLDRSFPEQYLSWVTGILRGDLGESFQKHRPVATEIRKALPVTLELAVLAMLISVVIAVPIAIIAAIYRNTPWDYLARLFSITGLSMPDFFVAIGLVIFLSAQFNYLSPIGYISPREDLATNLRQFLLPAAVLGFRLS
jgi:peptide/nickel transport system permease protein